MDRPTIKKPTFNDARGLDLALQSAPPFDFEGVTMRVFPLRARLSILQKFCDHFLNRVVPEEVARFRVFLPYVYLMVIDYGRMSVEAANLGWIAQREIAFSVPLQWYTVHDGAWTFKDWAFVSPFIYVDNELSMTTGREVYGWPKAMAWLNPDPSPWLQDPTRGPRLASVSTTVFPEVYKGQKQEVRVVLEIDQAAPPRFGQVPPDLDSMFAPWVAIPRALRGSAALLRDGYSAMMGLGLLQRRVGATRGNLVEMARQIRRTFDPRRPDLYFNTINLKQFRSASRPDRAAYQALTNATMRVSHLNRGGLMGDLNLLAGDSTGGLRIRLHRYASLPIIETLGLVVAEQWRGDGVDVAALEPVCPFWLDVDMHYDRSNTLASRTFDGVWRDPGGHALSDPTAEPPSVVSPGDAPAGDAPAGDAPARDTAPLFNTALGQATAAVAGPFDFPDTTLRVLPLLAEKARLVKFCDAYLNETLAGQGHEFKPWGSYVYLVASSYEATSSATNNVGFWADRDLVFYVPVQWYKDHELRTVALLPVFSYADSTTAAITGSEVSGIPTLRAEISSPADTWMGSAGPAESADRPRVRLESLVFPVMGEGAGAVTRKLMEVRGADALPVDDEVGWRFIAEGWGRTLLKEFQGKVKRARDAPAAFTDARTLALEVLANRQPVNILTLKQFRADGPGEACYQSLVQVQRVIERVFDIREIEECIHLFLHEHPSQPIARALGLVAKTTDLSGGDRVSVFQPVRPFWMRVSLHEELGRTVCFRADSEEWKEPTHADYALHKDTPYFTGEPAVGADLDAVLDGTDPRRLSDQTQTWLADPARARPMNRERAVAAVETIDVQMVVESVLSREWEHWGHARWRHTSEAVAADLAKWDARAVGGSEIDLQMQDLRVHLTRIREQTRRKRLIKDIEQNLLTQFRFQATLLNRLTLAGGLLHEASRLTDPNPRIQQLLDVAGSSFAEEKYLYALIMLLGRAGFELPAGTTEPPDLSKVYDVVRRDPDRVRAAVKHCTDDYKQARDTLVYKISKASQKPDFCLRRDSVGPDAERDRWFPRDECRDDDWYVGPKVELVPPRTDDEATASSMVALSGLGGAPETTVPAPGPAAEPVLATAPVPRDGVA